MKFALLGCNDDALALVESMREARQNPLDSDSLRVVACYEAPPEYAARLKGLFPDARFATEWEDVLLGTVADAVIVAPRSVEDREVDQLRKLVQSIPTVLVQPCCEAIVGFELDMIRSDVGHAIVPYVRGMGHPLLDEVRRLATGADGAIGAIRHLHFTNDSGANTRDEILTQLSLDSSHVRFVLGHLTDITATGAVHDDEDYRNLMVNFTSERGIPARWSLASDGEGSSRMVVVGESGRATLSLGPRPDEWRLRIDGVTEPSAGPEHYDWPRADLDEVESRLRQADPDRWLGACRDLEVADTVAYSLRRGRKINLISDAPSEEGTFKGVMAAGGCLILVLAFVVVICLSFVEGFRYPAKRNKWEAERQAKLEADRQARKAGKLPVREEEDRGNVLLRIWPVYPLLAFLLLQTLRSIARPRQTLAAGKEVESPPAYPPDD